jgi:DNA-binding transcriptional MocR family regulator
MPLYLKIANEIGHMIETGLLKGGERLLSLREMSRVKRVSIPTVIEAYRHLEDQGLIQVRAQSGYYVAEPGRQRGRPAAEVAAPIRALERTSAIQRALAGELEMPFDSAIPDDIFIPVRRLSQILSMLLRQDSGILGRHTSAWGDLGLRNQIARRLIEWNCQIDPEKLVITNGGLEAIGLCLRVLTGPGDIVVVESPAYYGFLNLIDAFGLRALEIPCDPTEGMVLDELRAALGKFPVKACLMSTSVSNPLGVTMPVARKKELLDVLGQREIPLVEDATFGDLHYDGPPPAAQGFDSQGRVLLCASMTKTLAPGFRLGWTYPGRYAQQVFAMKRVISGDQSEFLQKALAIYLENGGYERHLRRARHELNMRVRLALETIRTAFPAGTRPVWPSGGYLLWVELPGPIDMDFLQRAATDGGLGVAPGAIFSALGQYQRHFRLNVAQADPRHLTSSLRKLGGVICQRVGSKPA